MGQELASQQCPNCQAALHGQFCFACGQNQKAINRHFLTLVNEALEDVFTPNSRSARTLIALCFKPGFLTREYFSGRRARYIQPVRLYFITSIIFFFVASFSVGDIVTTIDISGDEVVPTADNQGASESSGNNSVPIANKDINLDEVDFGFLSEEESEAFKANLSSRIEQAVEQSKEEPDLAEKQIYIEDMKWGSLSEEESDALNARLNTQIEKAVELAKDDPGRAKQWVIDAAPPVIFCLLPIFAALLKLSYIGKGRFYTEHLVLALHNHSFIFLALLASNLIELLPATDLREWLAAPLNIWLPTYLLLSLKVTYQQGWLLTTIKFTFLGITYSILFLCVGLMTLLFGVMTL
tara:strand:+ start:16238 stop:17296 length:1059 start_codon:yes stop_codon:yes gene_type:complete